jgi:c-di-GMP-binding flagellar brake protein YcgR
MELSQQRTEVRRAARYQINAGMKGSNGIKAVIDISQGGARLACSVEFAVGAVVSLSFSLPNGRQIEADAVIRWTKKADTGDGWQSGCEFSRVSAADSRLLRNYFLCLAEINKAAGCRDLG